MKKRNVSMNNKLWKFQHETLKDMLGFQKIILEWCTGLGKSKMVIDYIKNLNFKTILIVVAENAHKDNWEKEFIKWNFNCPVKIECYASFNKYKNSKWDLIVFDEAHHLTALKLSVLQTIKVTNVILLSATLPEGIVESCTKMLGKFRIYKYSLSKAIENGFLVTPSIYLIPLELDNTNPSYIITEKWGKGIHHYKCSYKDRWTYLKNRNLYSDALLEISCTQKEKYEYLSEQFKYWKERYLSSRLSYIENKWLQVGLARKRFLGECKTKDVKNLLFKLSGKRYICFCTSIEQAEILGGRNAIHSKKSDSLEIIKNFNEKKINSLFAVGMLQEGQNLTDIEVGIITQLDGQERTFIQKFGRSMRASNPVQYIFYYKNTRDIEYLHNAIKDIKEEYIHILS